MIIEGDFKAGSIEAIADKMYQIEYSLHSPVKESFNKTDTLRDLKYRCDTIKEYLSTLYDNNFSHYEFMMILESINHGKEYNYNHLDDSIKYKIDKYKELYYSYFNIKNNKNNNKNIKIRNVPLYKLINIYCPNCSKSTKVKHRVKGCIYEENGEEIYKCKKCDKVLIRNILNGDK